MNQSFILQKIEQEIQSNRLLVLKGIKLCDIPEKFTSEFIDRDCIENGKINDDNFFYIHEGYQIAPKVVANREDTAFLTYESLVHLDSYIDIDKIKSEVVMLDFTITPYCFSNFKDFDLNLEDLAEKAEGYDIGSYDKMISSSISQNGNIYLQYCDQRLKNNFRSVKIFEKSKWDYSTLDTIGERDMNNNDLLFNYENRSFLKTYQAAYDRTITEVSILVDNETIQNTAATEQLEFLLGFLNELSVDYQLFRLEHDLAKSSRPELNDLLKQYWNSDEFRKLKVYVDPELHKRTIDISQAEVVETIIGQFENGLHENGEVKDIFLTAPTGAGKSLLFQLPGIYIGDKYNALSIVITPLKALMVDQVNQLKNEKGYSHAAYINSDISIVEREEILEQIENGDVHILYVAPELILSYDISHFLKGRRLGLYIVDEAHTVSTWGRDFRIDYWYLGFHINRVRKYARDKEGNEMKFPVVAVTATAPYGNVHDVAFETMNGLQMKAPIKYIGHARRDDIKFEIEHIKIDGNLQTEKVNRTVERIGKFEKLKDKTIIYCPFTSQVTELARKAYKEGFSVNPYHGSMNYRSQMESLERFNQAESSTMIATKAFGMGVDISDITRVHHLAPTGLLTDYIQEIGRAARAVESQGVASVDYSNRDFQFINQLHGMSRTHDWQLREVMRRLIRLYDESKEQNHLVTADDFAHIFSLDEDKIQHEVKKALLMIEKDLNLKFDRIPVLIARPKDMFSTVYASIRQNDADKLLQFSGSNSVDIIHYQPILDKDRTIVKIKLDKVWQDKFRHKSFGITKREFFNGSLFPVDVKPKLKLVLSSNQPYGILQQHLKDSLGRIEIALNRMNGFFTKNDFAIQLRMIGFNKDKTEYLADYLLPMFSQGRGSKRDNLSLEDVRQRSNFLQSKRFKGEMETKYRLVSNAFSAMQSKMRRTVRDLFSDRSKNTKYLSQDSGQKHLYLKIGQLLEVFELGSYEVSGGENPRIYVRINDPFRLRQQANSDYKNILLHDVIKRHQSGVALMREFFESNLSSDERWDFIEDFLLGNKI